MSGKVEIKSFLSKVPAPSESSSNQSKDPAPWVGRRYRGPVVTQKQSKFTWTRRRLLTVRLTLLLLVVTLIPILSHFLWVGHSSVEADPRKAVRFAAVENIIDLKVHEGETITNIMLVQRRKDEKKQLREDKDSARFARIAASIAVFDKKVHSTSPQSHKPPPPSLEKNR